MSSFGVPRSSSHLIVFTRHKDTGVCRLFIDGIETLKLDCGAGDSYSNILEIGVGVAHFVGQPRPPWLGTMSEVVFFSGAVLGLLAVVLWLVRRHTRFVALAREGSVFPTFDVGVTGFGRALGNKAVGAAFELALDGVGSTLRQIYCAPVVAAEANGTIIEVRTPGDWRGRFPRPSHMLVHAGNPYVALLGVAGISHQRVLRRRPAKGAEGVHDPV